MERGNIDPTFDSCKLVEAAGASFVARENVTDPKKMERTITKALEHKGFSYLEIFSNCHVNLGRKNKMASANANLEWIDSITLAKTKFDMLPIDEQDGKYPTGILKQDENAIEYTAAYEKVKEAHKNKTMVEI